MVRERRKGIVEGRRRVEEAADGGGGRPMKTVMPEDGAPQPCRRNGKACLCGLRPLALIDGG